MSSLVVFFCLANSYVKRVNFVTMAGTLLDALDKIGDYPFLIV